MLLDEQFFIKLLRQQLCVPESTEPSVSIKEDKKSEEIQIEEAIVEKDITIRIEDNLNDFESGRESILVEKEASKQRRSSEADVMTIASAAPAIRHSLFQLNIVSTEGPKSRKKPLFRMFMPARVLKMAREMVKEDDHLSVDNALRKASAVFGYHYKEMNEIKSRKDVRMSRKRASRMSRRKMRAESEPSEARISRVNGHLNEVLARRPSWCDLDDDNSHVDRAATKNSEVRIHPKKQAKLSPR